MIGRKDCIVSSAQCSLGTRTPSAYTQNYTAGPHLFIALKVTFDTSPFAVNYWLIVLINSNIPCICHLIKINSLEV